MQQSQPNARAVTLTKISKRRIWQLLSGAYHASFSRECEKTKLVIPISLYGTVVKARLKTMKFRPPPLGTFGSQAIRLVV